MLNNIYNWAMQDLYISCVLTSQSKYSVYYIILECVIMQTCLSNIYDTCLSFSHVLNNYLIKCADLMVLRK